MKRKLFSAALSTFALFLLMGAADATPQAATLLAEEEGAALASTALETEAGPLSTQISRSALAAVGTSQIKTVQEMTIPNTVRESGKIGGFAWTDENKYEPALDSAGVAGPGVDVDIQGMDQQLVNGHTYVSLAAFAQAADPGAMVSGDGWSVSINAGGITVTAVSGQLYLEANGRYLYIPEGVQSVGGQNYVPSTVAAKAFSGLQPGSSFYNQEDLFWLSRVIYRESGNQDLEGQMAVGNVILNRVASPEFPNTVEGVLAQKNQFSTYKSGALRETNPSESSVIAAKLVLDGGVVEETRGATFFDSNANSWAAKNKQFIATFGSHNFYG